MPLQKGWQPFLWWFIVHNTGNNLFVNKRINKWLNKLYEFVLSLFSYSILLRFFAVYVYVKNLTLLLLSNTSLIISKNSFAWSGSFHLVKKLGQNIITTLVVPIDLVVQGTNRNLVISSYLLVYADTCTGFLHARSHLILN